MSPNDDANIPERQQPQGPKRRKKNAWVPFLFVALAMLFISFNRFLQNRTKPKAKQADTASQPANPSARSFQAKEDLLLENRMNEIDRSQRLHQQAITGQLNKRRLYAQTPVGPEAELKTALREIGRALQVTAAEDPQGRLGGAGGKWADLLAKGAKLKHLLPEYALSEAETLDGEKLEKYLDQNGTFRWIGRQLSYEKIDAALAPRSLVVLMFERLDFKDGRNIWAYMADGSVKQLPAQMLDELLTRHSGHHLKAWRASPDLIHQLTSEKQSTP